MEVVAWNILYAESVVKDDIPRLDSVVKRHIQKAIELKLASDPQRFGKPLRYSLSHLRSLRVGSYRILYSIEHHNKSVLIVSIDHRKDIYAA